MNIKASIYDFFAYTKMMQGICIAALLALLQLLLYLYCWKKFPLATSCPFPFWSFLPGLPSGNRINLNGSFLF